MSEGTSSSPTPDNGKQTGVEPVLTNDVKTKSDERIRSMAARLAASAKKTQSSPMVSERGTPPANSVFEGKTKTGDVKPSGAAPEPEPTKETSEGKPKPEDKPAVTTPEPTTEGKPKKEAKTEEVSEDAKKFQSIADQRLTELETTKKELEKEREERKKVEASAKLVEDFQRDPVSFIQQNLPDLGKQLAAAGNPIAAIEIEASKYVTALDGEYKKQYGEDWTFNELEALKPGTPSFRYKLAIDAKVTELRQNQVSYIEQQRRGREAAIQQKKADRERVKTEFGLTEEDVIAAEKEMESIKLTPFLLYKVVLMDKIMQSKLGSIVTPQAPAPELTRDTTGSRRSGAPKVEISEGGRKIVSRLGTRAFSH